MMWMIFVGLFVGILAKLYLPGRDPGGIVVTILIGIAGSIIAGFSGRAIGVRRRRASGFYRVNTGRDCPPDLVSSSLPRQAIGKEQPYESRVASGSPSQFQIAASPRVFY